MRLIRIEFSGNRSLWAWSLDRASVRMFLAVLLCSALVLVAVLLRARQMEQELAQASDALAQMESLQQKNALRLNAREQQSPEEEAMRLQAQRLRALPWEAIFQAVETPTAPVRVQSFEPDLVRGLVKLQARADDLAAMQAYVRDLQQLPVFRHVALQRHAVPNEEGGGIEFACEAVLAATYRLPEVTEAQP